MITPSLPHMPCFMGHMG